MIDHGVWGEEKSAACGGGEEETRTGGVVHRQVTVPGPGDYKTVIYTLESFLFMGSMFVESHEFGGLWGCNFDGNKFGIIYKY